MSTNTCSTTPLDKKAFGKAVGHELLRRHGKQRTYPREAILRTVDALSFPADWSCWAMCLFASRDEFEKHHAITGEVCDYAAMKSEMVSAMTEGASSSWFDVDMSWLDWPDFDFSGFFDFLDIFS